MVNEGAVPQAEMQRSVTTIVVDASLVIAWALPNERHHELARRFLLDHQEAALVAPALYEMEIDSVLRLAVFKGSMSVNDAAVVLQVVNALPVEIVREPVVQGREVRPLAREIAEQLNQPRVYDATYAALAGVLGCEFWTADERFYNSAQAAFPYVRFIGTY